MSIDFHDGVLLVSAWCLLFINFCVFSLFSPSPPGGLVKFGPFTPLFVFLLVVLVFVLFFRIVVGSNVRLVCSNWVGIDGNLKKLALSS